MATCRNVVSLVPRTAPRQLSRQPTPNSRQISTPFRNTSALVITPFIFGSDKVACVLPFRFVLRLGRYVAVGAIANGSGTESFPEPRYQTRTTPLRQHPFTALKRPR